MPTAWRMLDAYEEQPDTAAREQAPAALADMLHGAVARRSLLRLGSSDNALAE